MTLESTSTIEVPPPVGQTASLSTGAQRISEPPVPEQTTPSHPSDSPCPSGPSSPCSPSLPDPSYLQPATCNLQQQSLEDFFTKTNRQMDELNDGIFTHARSLSGKKKDPEEVKQSISIIRSLECATRSLKRSIDSRIAQEKFLRPKNQKPKKEEEEEKNTYERNYRIYEDTVAALRKAREYRRIARADQGSVPHEDRHLCPEVLPPAHAPALEPDAPAAAGLIQGLPLAPMQWTSAPGSADCQPASGEGQPPVTAPMQWTNSPGNAEPQLGASDSSSNPKSKIRDPKSDAPPSGSHSTPNSSQINPQEPHPSDPLPPLPTGEVHHPHIGHHEASQAAPSQHQVRTNGNGLLNYVYSEELSCRDAGLW